MQPMYFCTVGTVKTLNVHSIDCIAKNMFMCVTLFEDVLFNGVGKHFRSICIYLFIYLFIIIIFFVFCPFLETHSWRVEVPRLGV